MKPSLGSFLNIAQAAKKLGVTPKSVREWCNTGKLPAIPKAYGHKTTYLISLQAVDVFLASNKAEEEKAEARKVSDKKHSELIPAWEKAMSNGFISGKPFSPATSNDYLYYAGLYFKRHQAVSISGLKSELARIPVHQVSKRQHYYKAILCLGKYLVQEGYIEAGFLQEIKSLFPKSHLPPKRHTVTEEQLESLMKATATEMETLIVVLLASTGLRASECCALQLPDIDISQQTLTVRLGKGNKTRKVGLTPSVIEALEAYLAVRSTKHRTDRLFLDKLGKPLHRHGLYQRLERLGNAIGVKVSPHALRRAFVTLNANKGRPLQMLQQACGHSDINTTMSYCRTSEQEVIKAMREWD